MIAAECSFLHVLGWRSWWSRCQSSWRVAKFSRWGFIKAMPRKGDALVDLTLYDVSISYYSIFLYFCDAT